MANTNPRSSAPTDEAKSAYWDAIDKGDAKILSALLVQYPLLTFETKSDGLIFKGDENGLTGMEISVLKGHKEAAAVLAQKPMPLDAVTNAARLAILNQDSETLGMLLKTYSVLTDESTRMQTIGHNSGYTLLHYAADRAATHGGGSALAAVEMLLKANPKLAAVKDEDGLTPEGVYLKKMSVILSSFPDASPEGFRKPTNEIAALFQKAEEQATHEREQKRKAQIAADESRSRPTGIKILGPAGRHPELGPAYDVEVTFQDGTKEKGTAFSNVEVAMNPPQITIRFEKDSKRPMSQEDVPTSVFDDAMKEYKQKGGEVLPGTATRRPGSTKREIEGLNDLIKDAISHVTPKEREALMAPRMGHLENATALLSPEELKRLENALEILSPEDINKISTPASQRDASAQMPKSPETTAPGAGLGLVEQVEKAVVNAVKEIVGIVTGDGKDHTTPLSNTVAGGQTRSTGKNVIG